MASCWRYIVPTVQRRDVATGVLRFAEKPTPQAVREMIMEGALWNTFILAGTVRALLNLFEGRFSGTITEMRRVLDLARSVRVGPRFGIDPEADAAVASVVGEKARL